MDRKTIEVIKTNPYFLTSLIEELAFCLLEYYKDGRVTEKEYQIHMPGLYEGKIDSIEFVQRVCK